ncbi:hypothetical protein Bca4012_056127 [Brassica carinata]
MQVLSVSLFWTGAVLFNTVYVIVSGVVFHVLFQCGQEESSSFPPSTLIESLRYAVTTCFGSICYGSLFTAAIRKLRWEIRGFRSKICGNEYLLCCFDFLFNLAETLVRFLNKYAYVHIAVYGKGFNRSARDAWELFQSTGVEALIDIIKISGAMLQMGTIFGGLITDYCIGIWAWIKYSDSNNGWIHGYADGNAPCGFRNGCSGERVRCLRCSSVVSNIAVNAQVREVLTTA